MERPCKRDGRWPVCKNRKRWKTAAGYLDDPQKIVASTSRTLDKIQNMALYKKEEEEEEDRPQ